MGDIDKRIAAVATERRFLITRGEVLHLGGSMDVIRSRLESGRWVRVHAGVYQVDRRPLDRKSRLQAAVLACGPEARVSHRAALLLWGMDGVRSAPMEVTMPFGNLAAPEDVIVHRSRRPTPSRERAGMPVSGPERALLECSAYVPPIVIGKALDSALRLNITSLDRMWMMLALEGGRGVKGTRAMRNVLVERTHDTATDSGSEYELLDHMRKLSFPYPSWGSSCIRRVVGAYLTSSGRTWGKPSRWTVSTPMHLQTASMTICSGRTS